MHLKAYTLRDVERALVAHESDEHKGDRAPKPIDVKRRLSASSEGGQRCAAATAAGRCEYPGIFSGGGRAWYCPWHHQNPAGPDASVWIERSAEIPFEHAAGKRAERIHAESTRAPVVVETAWDIAERHGNRPWRRTGEPFATPRRTDA